MCFKMIGVNDVFNTKGAVVLGYYGAGNWGDEAMLAGLLELLRRIEKDYPITIISRDSEDTARKHNEWTFPSTLSFDKSRIDFLGYRLRKSKLLTILSHSTFVMGGGDLIRDGSQYEVAPFWLQQMEQAIYARRKTILLGVSVGEIWKTETIRLVPKVLNQVDLLTVRDELSRQNLQKLGVNKTVHVIPDLALQNSSITIKTQSKDFGDRPRKRPKIGISIRSLSNRGKQLDDFPHWDFQQEVAVTIDTLVERFDAEIYIFPFQAHPYFYHPEDDDYIAAIRLLQFSRYSMNFHVFRYLSSLPDLCQGFVDMDIVIGMRLHSVILASALGIPMIAMEYDSKIRAFMDEIDQEFHSVPLPEFNREHIASMVEYILHNYQYVRSRILDKINDIKNKINPVIPLIKDLL